MNRLRTGSFKDEDDSGTEGPRPHKLNRSSNVGGAGKPGSLTDEEEHRDFHLRNLLTRAFDARRTPDTTHPPPSKDRRAELKALQDALARETTLRERQSESDRRTKLDKDAEEHMREIENEIYAEKQSCVSPSVF